MKNKQYRIWNQTKYESLGWEEPPATTDPVERVVEKGILQKNTINLEVEVLQTSATGNIAVRFQSIILVLSTG